MNDLHRKTFEELQLLIANSFASLRQPETSDVKKRPVDDRKSIHSLSASDDETFSDSDIPATQKRYKTLRISKKGAYNMNLDQQIIELLNHEQGENKKSKSGNNINAENQIELELEVNQDEIDKF
ncbi:hypothetical protein SNE40_000602 [Patella caerulea]|uniref:Uncharacterized protein n=1 Tax=Patella caerulea TaxID=87958 RepID=A0AAN8KE74_PATCE